MIKFVLVIFILVLLFIIVTGSGIGNLLGGLAFLFFCVIAYRVATAGRR